MRKELNEERMKIEAVQWSTLLHIDDIEPIGENDCPVLEAIRAIVVSEGMEHRFGICLLHRHFDLDEGEIVLERTSVEKRSSTTRVVLERDCPSAIQTVWSFSAEEGGVRCEMRCESVGMFHHDHVPGVPRSE